MSEKITEKITIWGIVQGVGFRPFVAKLAKEHGMQGQVRNSGGLVEILMTDEKNRIDSFVEALQIEKPRPAEIVHIRREVKAREVFTGFTILKSDDGDDEAAMLPADIAVCDSCMKEMWDPKNPRHLHPFISCMECGPRYTIVDRIPYDRENTSMVDFGMCEFCSGEYTDSENRRYHAQTISCHECGPMPILVTNDGEKIITPTEDLPKKKQQIKKNIDPILAAVQMLQEGKIIALKGVGGYYFVCSPFMANVVSKLRVLKGREEKPFAVMFPDMKTIRRHCKLTKEEQALLSSSARPIVLLERKQPADPISEEVYRSSRYQGAFMPSFGLQYLLGFYAGPLIMTSANRSELPMVKDDDEMLEYMKHSEDISAMLYNERKIRTRMDDSVCRIIDKQPQMIRRSKGYVPVPLYITEMEGLSKKDMVFATGGQLKSAFTLTKGSLAYVSQYFGDLDSLEAEEIYEENAERMRGLFRIDPGLYVCDLHPGYITTSYAEKRGKNVLRVQHHHAHAASVIAEHGLTGQVIGVSFDGTGYGTDGRIWGGEFLICNECEFERFAHLEYVRMIGGDSSMREGWKSAMSYVYKHEAGYAIPNDDVSESVSLDISNIIAYSNIREHESWQQVKAAISSNINVIESSSMGRLFDAVASLLGIQHENRYEGECAIQLENAAADALKHPGENKAWDLALEFHINVAQMILDVCRKIREKKNITQVALSGGVFQNKILMEKTLKLLRKNGFEVYYNISVPPNDGGISLGQAYLGMKYLEGKPEEND